MNKDRAKLLLTGKYPEYLINQYLEAVQSQFPDEDLYWTRHVKNEADLLHDMSLFAEAHPNTQERQLQEQANANAPE